MKRHFQTDITGRPPKPFQRTKGGNYSIRMTINGFDVWRSLKTKNKKTADTRAYKMWYMLQSAPAQVLLENPEISLFEALEEHQQSDAYIYLSESQKAKRLRVWASFTVYCKAEGIEDIYKITRETISDYLSEGNRKNKTWNNLLNEIRQVLKQSCGQYKMENPASGVEQKSITRGENRSRSYRPFTREEIKKIFTGLEKSRLTHKQEWIAACWIALYTGLRFKDIALLQWPKIHGLSFIETVPFKTAGLNKSVHINICPALANILKGIKKTSFYVLPGLAQEYSEQESTKHFQRFLKRIELTDDIASVGFHSFRSNVITEASKNGIDLESFGGVVGHSNKSMTEHYNKAAQKIDLSFLNWSAV